MQLEEWPVKFIGRYKELSALEDKAKAWNTRLFVFIAGPGGIGKTRLLDHIGGRFLEPSYALPIKVLPIIDFDDDRYKFSQNIGITIGRNLGTQAFDAYFDLLRDLRRAEELSGETGPILSRRFLAINREFAKAFNQLSSNKRILLRFDTTEAVPDSAMMDYVFSIAKDLQNVLIVLAGRDAHILYNRYKDDLGEDATLLTLEPFAMVDFKEYLNEKKRLLAVGLNDEWLEKLYLVAGGIPVLVDMAIEWAQTNRRLKWLDELSLAEIEKLRDAAEQDKDGASQKRFTDLQTRLQQEIVMPIGEFQSELDYLQFLLAKVYPLDLNGVAAMLNLDEERAQLVLEQAYNSVAVKRLSGGWIKLHDLIQDLVVKHVWRDEYKEWEHRDSLNALRYLEERTALTLEQIRQLKGEEDSVSAKSDPAATLAVYVDRIAKEAEFWTLRLEHLRRQVAIDVQEGFNTFLKDFDLARKEVASTSARFSLLDAISSYAQLENPATDIKGSSFSQEQRLFILKEKARQLFFTGTYHAANETYDRLLGFLEEGSELFVELLNGKANSLLRLGRFREALEINLRALRLAKSYPALEIKILIDTGWFYRRMGDLGEAADYYEKALRLAFERDDEESIALAYQNRAYVHALEDEERFAMGKVGLAIRMWPELIRNQPDLIFRLGQAYNIAGEICLEFERPIQALEYFGLSWNIFTKEESGKATWRGKASAGSGFAHWQLAISALKAHDDKEAERELDEAERALEWSARNADASDIDQPMTLNRLGEVYFLQGKWEDARSNWQESRNIAKQIGDAFNELHSLSDLARLAFYCPTEGWATDMDFKVHYKDWRKKYPIPYAVLEGLFRTYLGHLALRDRLIEDAVNYYTEGLPILAVKGTYSPFNLIGQLDFIEQEILSNLSPSEVNELSSKLRKRWIEGGHDRIALGHFRNWHRNVQRIENPAGDTP